MSIMDALQKKSGGIAVPDFCIRADGIEIAKSLNLRIDNIRIKLSTDAAGSLSFDVLNAYDLSGRCFSSNVKAAFLPGKSITAEIGYVGKREGVFKGYIHTVNYEYTDVPMLTVTGLDVIRFMQENCGLPRSYENMNATDVFKEIMKKYAGICPASAVKADPSGSAKEESITQKENDYQFIKNTLCAMECRDFYIWNGDAFFTDPAKNKGSAATLEWGRDFLSFSYEKNYLHKKIMVTGADKNEPTKKITYSKTVAGTKQKTVLSAPIIKNISMESQITAQEAKLQAEKEAAGEKRGSLRCSGSCIGRPDLIPGKCLTIKKLDPDLDGTYEIQSVEHSLGTEGFTTQFELGGKK